MKNRIILHPLVVLLVAIVIWLIVHVSLHVPCIWSAHTKGVVVDLLPSPPLPAYPVGGRRVPWMWFQRMMGVLDGEHKTALRQSDIGKKGRKRWCVDGRGWSPGAQVCIHTRGRR